MRRRWEGSNPVCMRGKRLEKARTVDRKVFRVKRKPEAFFAKLLSHYLNRWNGQSSESKAKATRRRLVRAQRRRASGSIDSAAAAQHPDTQQSVYRLTTRQQAASNRRRRLQRKSKRKIENERQSEGSGHLRAERGSKIKVRELIANSGSRRAFRGSDGQTLPVRGSVSRHNQHSDPFTRVVSRPGQHLSSDPSSARP